MDSTAPINDPNSLIEPVELALQSEEVIDRDFDDAVRTALDVVGGSLLFQMRIDNVEDCQRIAAASVGDGELRQYLLISLPVGGGPLKVETAASSTNPLAGITEAYAGLLDVFKAAA